jgi:WD40 repeat protein
MKHNGPISGIACYASQWVATAGYDNQVILWDADTQRSVARANHDHLANFCQFSPDGKFLFTSSSDYTARAYSVPAMQLVALYGHHEDDVESLAVSPSGRFVATASRDHKVRVFEVNGKILATLSGHEADALSVAWNPDETQLVSSGDDGTIRTWDWREEKQISLASFEGVETDTIALTESGLVFCGNDVGQIIVIKDSVVLETVQAHNAGIKKIKCFKAGKTDFVVSSSYDRKVKLWKQEGSKLSLHMESEFPAQVWPRTCDYLPQNKLVFGSFGSTYATWNFADNTWDATKVSETACVNAVAFRGEDMYTIGDSGVLKKNGESVKAVGSLCNFLVDFDGTIMSGGQLGIVLDAESGEKIYRHRSPLNCGVKIPGKNLLVIGAYTGELLVFTKGANGIQFVKEIKAHPNAVKGVALSKNQIMSVSADRSISFVNISDLADPADRPLAAHISAAHEKIINACTGLGDDVFVSVSRDLQLSIWRAGEKLASFKTPHDHSIKCVSRSDDFRYIASGSYNGEVALFDTVKKRFVENLRPTAAGVSSLCFAQGSFWASSYDGNVYKISPPQ